MPDKLYVSALNFGCNTLSEAGIALQGYLSLNINPILTDTDILVTITDYIKTLLRPTEYIDVLSICGPEGQEIRGWTVEMERRADNVIQGKLIGRGIGSLRFVMGRNDKFIYSGIMAPDERSRSMILRMSEKLGIVL